MTNQDDAAFARPYTEYGSSQYGLTKREYFAAMFLAAIIQRDGSIKPVHEQEADALRAAIYADTLIKKLNEQ